MPKSLFYTIPWHTYQALKSRKTVAGSTPTLNIVESGELQWMLNPLKMKITGSPFIECLWCDQCFKTSTSQSGNLNNNYVFVLSVG